MMVRGVTFDGRGADRIENAPAAAVPGFRETRLPVLEASR
jgi:hypothetical protein